MTELSQESNGKELQHSGLENLDVIRGLKEEFSPEEALLGEFILSTKGLGGLTARLKPKIKMDGKAQVEYFILGDKVPKAFADKAGVIADNYTKIKRFQNELIEKLVEKLGISCERYKEIKNFVYENETQM